MHVGEQGSGYKRRESEKRSTVEGMQGVMTALLHATAFIEKQH
jgi:hypothetical protein